MPNNITEDHTAAHSWFWCGDSLMANLPEKHASTHILCLGVHGSWLPSEQDAAAIAALPDILRALGDAERFIRGFEDDEMQEGIPELLARMRAHLPKAPIAEHGPKLDPHEAAALAAGWIHGGDQDGFWFHKATWGSWKEAASWAGTDQQPETHGAIYDTARELCEAEKLEVQHG